MQIYEAIKASLAGSKRITVITHQNPDGDAIGSALALGRFLRQQGHTVQVAAPNPAPAIYDDLEGYGSMLFYTEQPEKTEQAIRDAEVVFVVDMNNAMTRSAELKTAFAENTRAVRILIDHHIDPADNCQIVLSDTSASSTALLVCRVITALVGEEAIDRTTADLLYIGMMTDTGNFSYGNLDGGLYRTIGLLVEKGADPVRLHIKVYQQQSENRVRLTAYAIHEKMVVIPEKRAAYITLTKRELRKFNFQEGDTEGIVNIPLDIKGIVNSAIFMEKNNFIKVSLRSTVDGGADVNRFARDHYTGGGHRNAAGARSDLGMQGSIDAFVKNIDRY